MINSNGTLILNGIQDPELVKILEVKMRHEQSLGFNPQQLQLGNVMHQGKAAQVYNNVNLGWSNENGLEAVQEIVHFLLKKEEKAEKAQGR
jgi:protein-arginine kinase